MNNKIVKTLIQIALSVIAIILVYLIYNSIMNPIKFNEEKDIRYKATIEKLIDIRSAEVAYKDVNGKYADSFDKLIYFVKNDSFPAIRKIGEPAEDLIDSLGSYTEAEALSLKNKLIIRDTIRIAVLDSIFSKDYEIDNLRFVPFTEGKEFTLKSGSVKTASGVVVQVFEAAVTNDVLLNEMDKQLLINLNDEKLQMGHFPGLKVGDINHANNNNGNWE
ncbi:MAG: hypothetical protein ABIJ97_06290 [Bacteroidota bacterium]